jgi:hypothetical protein
MTTLSTDEKMDVRYANDIAQGIDEFLDENEFDDAEEALQDLLIDATQSIKDLIKIINNVT